MCVCQRVCYLRIHSQTLSRQAEKSSENRTTSVFLRSKLCLSSDASRRLIFITYTVRQTQRNRRTDREKLQWQTWPKKKERHTGFSLPTCLLRMMNSTAAPPSLSSSGLQFSIVLNTEDRQKERIGAHYFQVCLKTTLTHKIFSLLQLYLIITFSQLNGRFGLSRLVNWRLGLWKFQWFWVGRYGYDSGQRISRENLQFTGFIKLSICCCDAALWWVSVT